MLYPPRRNLESSLPRIVLCMPRAAHLMPLPMRLFWHAGRCLLCWATWLWARLCLRTRNIGLCVTLLTTVGYGDLVPKASVAKVFCCGYVVCGVSMVSASLGVVLGRMQAKINTSKIFSPGA